MPFLREAVPEITTIILGESVQVLALIPDHDAASSISGACADMIQGVVEETVKFKGPAYRSKLESPCVLYQLRAKLSRSSP